MKKVFVVFSIIAVVAAFSSCQKLLPGPTPAEQLLDGLVEGLTREQNA